MKNDARLVTTSHRVAPLKSGKAIELESVRGIAVLRVYVQAGRCHGGLRGIPGIRRGALAAMPPLVTHNELRHCIGA
jgi:hypothetical protein